jgi:CRP-like cAMP-binding protein
VASIVFTSERGTSIELATIGSEGLVGATFLLGPHTGHADSMMQVGGRGYVTPLKLLEQMFNDSPAFHKAGLEFCQHQTLQGEVIVACNRLHTAEQRFSRWLLMVQDRLQSDTITMTQEFLSNMLGTRRTTVAEVSAELARAGAIENRRGVVHILDRAKLESHACECYALLHELYDSLYVLHESSAGNRPRNGTGI